MATYGWKAAKVGKAPTALEATTQDGTTIIVRANVKETSAKQGLTNTRQDSGNADVRRQPNGMVQDVVTGGSLNANQERLNEGRKERRRKAQAA